MKGENAKGGKVCVSVCVGEGGIVLQLGGCFSRHATPLAVVVEAPLWLHVAGLSECVGALHQQLTARHLQGHRLGEPQRHASGAGQCGRGAPGCPDCEDN